MRFTRAALPLLVVLLSTGSVLRAGLVTNGGFEIGYFTGWTHGGQEDWYVKTTYGGITGPHSGTYYANTGCMGASCITASSAYFYQDLTTVPGKAYTLTFWVDWGVGGGTGSQAEEFMIVWNKTTSNDNSQDAVATTDPGWILYTVNGLTVTLTTTRLEFFGRQDPRHLGVDDIDVVASDSGVPEPASLTLAGGALLGIGLAAWRRKKRPVMSGADRQ